MKRWTKEVNYFLRQQVEPSLSPGQRKILESQMSVLFAEIERRVVEASAAVKPFARFSKNLTPSEYETFCAQLLRKHGWDVRVTKQSGDQGVDLIVTRDGLRVVVQCKLYKKPVCNRAVQEQADFGVVVSNNRYTSSAVALASTNGIMLLHHDDLPNLQAIIERSVDSPTA